MRRISAIILAMGMIGGLCLPAGAQPEGNVTLEPIRNPFVPQLPEKPKIDETATTSVQTQLQQTGTTPPPANSGTGTTPPKTAAQGGETTPVPPPVPKPNFRISGLIWNSPRPQVIINGQVLDIGDEIQGFRIESINQTGVDVSIRGVTLTVEP